MTTIKNKVGVGLLAVAIAFLLLPGLTHAATYGYVGNDGFVRSIVANTWQVAMNTASQISIHSGVVLLESAEDFEMVGDHVIGI